ncbi:hypothetical protein FHS18_003062 [Paenibacillus phyllosphaerae]|uniref:Uncharacterized protein n=1 Tax=Paenibacillus phyllosphaerae TaxID=274593 RepID=A0A7W5AYX0_9BACL|nr:DUF5381 family protein [Paenibacillus phyllosphaerae]MBB3110994.1 hypothetical protein [Paenibacillus phyllosphaerae]
MKSLRETESGIEVIPAKFDAGCFVSVCVLMLAGAAVLLYFAKDMFILKGILYGIVGVIGALFFGGALLKVLSVVRSKEPLFEVRSGYLQNKRKKVALTDIDELTYGWHTDRPSGMVFQALVVRTVRNNRYYFSTYNMVSQQEIDLVVRQHILPYATAACRESWEATEGKTPFGADENAKG